MDVPFSCLISERCVSLMIISSLTIKTVIAMDCDDYSVLLLIMMTLMAMAMMMRRRRRTMTMAMGMRMRMMIMMI